jgi:hypothetical protein
MQWSVLILREARTRVRVRRNFLACALLRMRTTIACGILHHFKQPYSFPRRAFAPGSCTFASLTPIEGWAERRETFGCVRGTRWACHDAARQALARRLASHDAGRSPLGAPPWRFWAPGRASFSGICAGSVSSRSQMPGWRGPGPPGASGYKPPPQDATPRSAFRIVSRRRPSMSEAGTSYSLTSISSQEINSDCGHKIEPRNCMCLAVSQTA